MRCSWNRIAAYPLAVPGCQGSATSCAWLVTWIIVAAAVAVVVIFGLTVSEIRHRRLACGAQDCR
jgi:hypothetical protein